MKTVRQYSLLLLIISGFFSISICTPYLVSHASSRGTQKAVQLSSAAAQQIQSLITEKLSRTPEQNKIDSQLLYSMRMNRHEELAVGHRKLKTGVKIANNGTIEVDIKASEAGAIAERLKAMNAEVISSLDQTVRARVPLDQLEEIAGWPETIFIMQAYNGVTS